MPIKMRPVWVLFLFMVIAWNPGTGNADVPVVSHLMVTDVTTVSFSVIWASSEASTADIEVYEDADGTIAVADAIITPHPVNDPINASSIVEAAENSGVMKVMVTGLQADTTYFFKTITTSISTDDITEEPAASPFSAVTTELATVRTYLDGTDVLPFSNDVIIEPCYLEDGTTPADGSLLIATVAGGHHPITAFVGDGVDSPYALIDLNNMFSRETFENIDLTQGINLTLLNFRGVLGNSIVTHHTPPDHSLSEIKVADAGLNEGWNFVAFQVEPSIVELTQFFGEDFSKINAVWAYDGATEQWSKYKEYDPFNTNDLTEVHGLKGYWVDLKAGEQISVKVHGTLMLNTTIPLHAGWNLVTYSVLLEIDLIEALAPIVDQVEAVWTYSGDAGWEKYKIYDPFNTNNLGTLIPGRAYWIQVNADCDWTVGS
jgi:hypothetical protein